MFECTGVHVTYNPKKKLFKGFFHCLIFLQDSGALFMDSVCFRDLWCRAVCSNVGMRSGVGWGDKYNVGDPTVDSKGDG
jgi:hypothetical protein